MNTKGRITEKYDNCFVNGRYMYMNFCNSLRSILTGIKKTKTKIVKQNGRRNLYFLAPSPHKGFLFE